MALRFKDDITKKIFEENKSEYEEVEKLDENDMDDLYQAFIDSDKENPQEENEDIEEIKELENLNLDDLASSQDLMKIESTVNRIESKQNSILEILEKISLSNSNKKKKVKPLKKDEIDLLTFNLNSFNNHLIILSKPEKDGEVKELLLLLNKISEYLLANSFYIFTLDKSPVKKALTIIDNFVINETVTQNEFETRKLLKEIEQISSMEIFEQNYYYSRLLLEKGLLLQSIILLNEAISIYIIESVKGFSKPIEKYTCLIGEQNIYKLYSQAKDFFISLFPTNGKNNEKIIPLFPHHKFNKEIDNDIAHKFNNLYTTRLNKGDAGLFEKYSYIIDKVRKIRNNLAHGNMELDFFDLKQEMLELIKDFEYLSIEKNIFKYKFKR